MILSAARPDGDASGWTTTGASRVRTSIAEPLFLLDLVKPCTRSNKLSTRHSGSLPDLEQRFAREELENCPKPWLGLLFDEQFLPNWKDVTFWLTCPSAAPLIKPASARPHSVASTLLTLSLKPLRVSRFWWNRVRFWWNGVRFMHRGRFSKAALSRSTQNTPPN